MQLNTHITFDGRCEAAFKFYAQLLGAQITSMLPYADSPMGSSVPPEWRGKIVHANLKIGDRELAGADVQPGQYEPPRGFYVLLNVDSIAEAERIFAALSDGGVVQMALANTFWAARFGAVVDRFGVPWEVNCGLGG